MIRMNEDLKEYLKSQKCELTLYDLCMDYIETFNIDRLLMNNEIKLSEEQNRKLTESMLDAQDLLINFVLAKFGD